MLQQRLHLRGPRPLGCILPAVDAGGWGTRGRMWKGPQHRGGAARDFHYPDSIRGKSSELPAVPGR